MNIIQAYIDIYILEFIDWEVFLLYLAHQGFEYLFVEADIQLNIVEYGFCKHFPTKLEEFYVCRDVHRIFIDFIWELLSRCWNKKPKIFIQEFLH